MYLIKFLVHLYLESHSSCNLHSKIFMFCIFYVTTQLYQFDLLRMFTFFIKF
ncbi:hypothetical protein GLOIN_2v1648206 [Rhizophagus irregularis DAOM 181602=DAOM 197198]|uniref:Uncharacterized protein n=1 Tax=Rhizophagus irregularis (strain DAOM 181602 / DAOM 197198 / MUCL 43194) TaxID=747089 RepID=A0A2P4PPM8_RHIID|nr:hypothetical protein GLOIN_2v1648206 [Rhizophagus irregularis DAOM 181602=DAOM 197198]POG67341.1 hypothetical protein GLOIN_2v1648206 [Rhizophagus irregularis DAOM 181602=DAOM 197198]|eukprot:XP_025174207.1 hypothetical protein GLOIN_2v1648206 [Rhizophagus irregularis DAOM 181602=DAOM 197198]